MECLQGGFDAEVAQQLACGSGVLGKHCGHIGKHLKGTRRHVAEVADRRRDDDELSATHETKVRMMRLANSSFKLSTSDSSPRGERASWN